MNERTGHIHRPLVDLLLIWSDACDHLIQNTAEGKDIGANIRDPLPVGLEFGGQIALGPIQFHRFVIFMSGAKILSRAKIEEHKVPLRRDPDVRRLQVMMYDLTGMKKSQGVAQTDGPLQGPIAG